MNLKHYVETLTTNAVDLHMAMTRNCVLAGLMLAGTMLLTSTLASILHLYGFEHLPETPRRLVYLLLFLQLLALGSLWGFDRHKWRKHAARQRHAWLTWFGFWMVVCGAALLTIAVDAFTISMAAQAVVLFSAGLGCYFRSERRK